MIIANFLIWRYASPTPTKEKKNYLFPTQSTQMMYGIKKMEYILKTNVCGHALTFLVKGDSIYLFLVRKNLH